MVWTGHYTNNFSFLDFCYLYLHRKKKETRAKWDYILRPTSNGHLDSSALVNSDSLPGLSAGCSKFLNVLDNIQALDNLAKDDVFSIEPASDDLSLVSSDGDYRGDEELGAVGV